ncbi:MAG: PhoPQ-activated pathogenicity-related family protein, partial [Candidatus Hydrogenedentes bacterium]|nr:PhoPQ-activated pathogenicity-related family protein [Candidatus Hydrogenedentota bacterium]
MRALLGILLITLSLPSVAATDQHPLLSYVQQQDDSFRWEKKATIIGEGYTAHVIDLHSQRWLTRDEVDRTEWQHWLTIVVPDRILYDKALLL